MFIASSSERPHSSAKRSTRSPRRAISRSWLVTTTVSTRARESLDIEALQHLGRRFVQLLGSANVLEAVQKVVRPQALFLGAAEIVNHLPAMHHHEPVAEMRSL